MFNFFENGDEDGETREKVSTLHAISAHVYPAVSRATWRISCIANTYFTHHSHPARRSFMDGEIPEFMEEKTLEQLNADKTKVSSLIPRASNGSGK